MVRRFFRDSAVYFIPSALSSGLSLFLFPLYAHHFTPREYGELDLLILAQVLVNFTVAFEIYQGVGVYVAGEKDPTRARAYASTGLLFTIGAYALFGVVAEVFATPITRLLLGATAPVTLTRIAALWMIVQGVLTIAQAQLRWQLRASAFAMAAVINAVFTMLPAGFMVLVLHLGVKGALLGQLGGSAVALIYVAVISRRTFNFLFDVAKWKEMLRVSIPLVASSVGGFLNLYADRLVIQHTRSLGDVGVYGVGFRIATIVSLLLVGFQGAALPLFLANKDDPATPGNIARIFTLFATLGLSMFVAISLLATPILRVAAAAPYQRAVSVVPFLVLSVVFAGMYMFAPGPGIARKTGAVAKVTFLAGVVNLLLALVLVPRYGITGAGVATACSSVGYFVAIMTVSQHYYRVPHRWRRLTVGGLAVVAYVAIMYRVLPQARTTALSVMGLTLRVVAVGGGIVLAIWVTLGITETLRMLHAGLRLKDGFASMGRSKSGAVGRGEGR